jgi:hypothetical protein
MNNSGAHHIYHAHALGVAGQIDRPAPQLIKSQASTSLSPTGGYGSDHTQNFEVKGVISFRSAFVEVAGSYDSGSDSHTTVASAVVEDLNIMGIVTADRIVARLASSHPKGDEGKNQADADKQLAGEPSVSPIGSYFENLKIAGIAIDAQLATSNFHRHGTYSSVKQNKDNLQSWLLWTQLKDVKNKHSSLDRFCRGLENLPESHGMFLYSLANVPTPAPTPGNTATGHGLEIFGSVIYIPGFGVVHLAELLIERHSRRLNMLRIHMGSPIAGSFSIATAFSNGSTYPPIGGGGG